MVVVGRLQPQFVEDPGDVLADGLGRDAQAAGDRDVGPPLRHQREHLAFPGRQRGQRRGPGSPREDLGDHLGIHGRATAGHPLHRVHELPDVADPVLEQVTDTAGAVGEQLAGVELLDVLRQDQDRETGAAAARAR